MLGNRRFGDPNLEQSYQIQQLQRHSTQLLYVLCIFTASLLLVALSHLPNPDLGLLWATVSAACTLGLNIFLNVRTPAKLHGTIVIIGSWLCISVLSTLPAGGQHALLPVIVSHFTFYTHFPFGILSTAAICWMLSMAQITAFIVLSPGHLFSLHQLAATILVHIWSHFIGVYMYSTKNRLCRAAFLNARNALSSQHEAIQESAKMGSLLGSALPPHVISSVQSQLGTDVPKIYVEHYGHASVVYAKIYGLQIVLNQISVQDGARLLNEFDSRVDQLVKMYGFIRVQSDAIVAVAGVPQMRNDHALMACHFARDLITLFRSFCEATLADLQLKVGIGSGSISSGIVGARKWHYEVIGVAFDNAKHLENKASLGTIVISEDTRRLVNDAFTTDRMSSGSWLLLHPNSGAFQNSPIRIPISLLFPTNTRRFSLVTLPQAIARVLQANIPANRNDDQSSFNANATNTQIGRRKRKSNAADNEDEDEHEGLLKIFSMKFTDIKLEHTFHAQMDRWFIPALCISILFLLIYGVFQILVMPRLLTTLALTISALLLMFILLLTLYINFFESFCYFITRTSAGHSVAILLVLVVLFMCGIVNTYSCPSFLASSVCHIVHYPAISYALWVITSAVFVGFSSWHWILVQIPAFLFYAIHVFGTHSDLYFHFSIATGWRVEFDLLIGILALTLLIYLQARRNERLIRLDYLSKLKIVDDSRQLGQLEHLNQQILLAFLPAHIAHNYTLRTETYHHLCQTVGILSIKFGQAGDWQGEFGFDRLNRIIYELDQMVEHYVGLEKVRSAHCIYTVAVGVLPEMSKNVNDTPLTISDLLASLITFALKTKSIGDDDGVDVSCGMDCGSALSLVIGQQRPRYEVFGIPCTRAAKLKDAISLQQNQKGCRIMVSEEIFLALRPRPQFSFDEQNPITVAPGLIGYILAVNSTQNRPILNLNNNINVDAASDIAPNSKVDKNTDFSLSANIVHPEADSSSSTENSLSDFEDALCERSEEDNTGEAQDGDNSQSTAIHKELSSFVLPSDLQALANDRRINAFDDDHPAEKRKNETSVKNGRASGRNPLEMFGSMNSSFSSELYSVDMSIESDSEIEWITPEMVANGKAYGFKKSANLEQKGPRSSGCHRYASGSSVSYKGDRARQYSDFSENERSGNFSSKMRRKKFRPQLSRNGPKLPGWLSKSSFNSELSLQQSREGSVSALDRLNLAARKVDKMLQELATVDGNPQSASTAFAPFPIPSTGVTGQMNGKNPNFTSTREMSSACQTEYDNAESEDICSDSEMLGPSTMDRNMGRLEELKRALLSSTNQRNHKKSAKQDANINRNNPFYQHQYPHGAGQINGHKAIGNTGASNGRFDNGSEADIESASSMASSMMFDNLRWKSDHSRSVQSIPFSIGYENEYELADETANSSIATSLSQMSTSHTGAFVPQQNGIDVDFAPVDAENDNEPKPKNDHSNEILDARGKVYELSRDIRRNFGDYQLASFSDIEN